MSVYHKNFASWRAFINNHDHDQSNLVSEILDSPPLKKVFDFIADANIEDVAFDDLFDGKMRIILPLTFDPETMSEEDLQVFSSIMRVVKRQGWVVDSESFARGMAFKEVAPTDFGKELNLKRYGSEDPPPPKKKEMRIGRIVSKSKHLSSEQKKWYSDNSASIVPMYTSIVSRYPVDILRMADFKALRSCHSPPRDISPSVDAAGSFFKCVGNEVGHGPVAYAVKTEKLNNFLKGKPIEYFDDSEILKDLDRDIEGVTPVSRLRLRRFRDESRNIDLAMPELRSYGSRLDDFLEKIRKWAYKEQFHKLDPMGDSEIASDIEWWRPYMEKINALKVEKEELEDEGTGSSMRAAQAIEEELESLTEELQEKIEKFEKALPDMDDFKLYGGSYQDTPTEKIFANFLGLKKLFFKEYNNETGKSVYTDASLEAGIPLSLQAMAREEYNVQEEEEANEAAERIEQWNRDMHTLQSLMDAFVHIYGNMQDLDEMGLDLQEMAEADRLFLLADIGFTVRVDAEEFEGAEYELPDHKDWKEMSILADELLESIEDIVDYTTDHGVEIYDGNLEFMVRINNDDHHYGVKEEDVREFILDMYSVDRAFGDIHIAIRKRLAKEGYMRYNPFYDFFKKVREKEIKFDNFRLEIDAGAVFFYSSKEKLGTSPFQAATLMVPSTADPTQGFIPNNDSSGNVFNRRPRRGIIEQGASKFGEQVLNLIKTGYGKPINPRLLNYLNLYITTYTSSSTEKVVNAQFTCVVVESQEEEVIVELLELIDHIDKNYSYIMKAVSELLDQRSRDASKEIETNPRFRDLDDENISENIDRIVDQVLTDLKKKSRMVKIKLK